MAGITLDQAEAQLAALLAAQTALISSGLSETEVFGKKIKKHDMKALGELIDYWDKKVSQLTAKGTRTGRRVRGATPTV